MPADARVFGEISFNAPNTGPEDILRFCESARQLFQAVPTRRSLHAFRVCGAEMELWVFNRSGAYSSEAFNLKQHPYLLFEIMTSYVTMNDDEVGIASFIRQDGLGRFVAVDRIMGKGVEKFYLGHGPIAAPQYIVGPGPTCFSAGKSSCEGPELVVKFAWREEERHTEHDLLQLTAERHV
jgi:hypothetical protein